MTSGDLSLEQANRIQEAHADERRRNLLVQCAIDMGYGNYPGNVRFDEAIITTALALEAMKRAERFVAKEALQLSQTLREIGGESLVAEILSEAAPVEPKDKTP